jgi:MurNAc alpha-1-phosphate uridylyltransferase
MKLPPVAILAGGLATRLRPITETMPKSLVDVRGKPFIEHQLRLLHLRGITEVVLCVGHLGWQIEEVIGDGADFGLRVRYSHDGAFPLGTGGAVCRALDLLGDEFFVLYGDSYLTCDYEAVYRSFRAAGRPALMTVYRNEGKLDESNVEFTDGRIRRYYKPGGAPEMRHIDYGLGVFRREAFGGVLNGERMALVEVYQYLLGQGRLAAHEVHERFYEIGSITGLKEFRALEVTP